MIGKLQRRFILIAVAAVAAVLAVIMGFVCVTNYSRVVSDADRTLSFLSVNSGSFPKDGKNVPDDAGWPGLGPKPELSPEAPFETRFFTVVVNDKGEAVSVNTGSIAAVETEQAVEFAERAYAGGRTKGFTGVYRYHISETPAGSMIVFLDCTRGLNLFYQFLEICLGGSLIGLAGVSVLILLFSKRAIKPIADSYEKQKRFITDASHELKTPLAVINASTDVLEMTQGETEWSRGIREQVSRLTALTNSLVSLARMDERSARPIMTEFSLSDAVEESLAPFFALAGQLGKRFETHIQRSISYTGNEEELRRLVSILADNALKYSNADGEIAFTLKSGAKGPVLTAVNSVEAIEKGGHDELFARFYRGDSSRSSAIGGFGIGLSVARAIVARHGGKINARSEDGRSLNVSVTLF